MAPRDEILKRVRKALGTPIPRPVLPPARRTVVEDRQAEIECLLNEVQALGGKTQRIMSHAELQAALGQLVQQEQVRRATLWREIVPDLAQMLTSLQIELVSPQAGKEVLADCDLGITGADAAIAESGTIVVRTSPGQPERISLMPRVHLAIFRPAVLRADLALVLAEIKKDRHAVLITGPSRTADIEKTLTIGVHGPKVLYVWSYEE